MPGVSLSKPQVGEDGRGRFTGDIDPGGGKGFTGDSACPETTPAKVRGLVGGVVDISSS